MAYNFGIFNAQFVRTNLVPRLFIFVLDGVSPFTISSSIVRCFKDKTR
jgi:hypothetical protein